MKSEKKLIRIAVLDDSDFYNRLLSHELESYCKILTTQYPLNIEIDSFSDPRKFSLRLEKPIDIAFVDYFLGGEEKGDKITQKIKKKHESCKVIIISQSNSITTTAKCKKSGATEFIYKDKYAIENACLALYNNLKNIIPVA